MTGTVRTPHQAATDVRQRLEEALRGAGLDAGSPIVVSDKVEGIKVSRIRFSPLTLDQARSLTAKLGGQVSSWGKHLGAKEVGRDLDTALRAAKIIANPSLIVVSSVNGLMTNELLPPSLTLIHAERLVRILEEVSQ